MEVGALQRHTVDEDPECLPSAQIFVRERVVWHDLHFVHTALVRGGGNPDKHQWLQHCQQYWASADVRHPHVHIRTRCTASSLISNICDSFALYTLLWLLATRARTMEVVKTCAAFLRNACGRAEICAAQDTGLLAELECRGGIQCLYLHKGRQVTGLRSAIADGLQSQLAKSVMATWTSMHAEGQLRDPFESAEHQLADILHFAVFCGPERKSRGLRVVPALQRVLEGLRVALTRHLARHIDIYILDVYLQAHKSDKPALALLSPQKQGIRQYVRVQPESVWSLIHKARGSGLPLTGLLQAKSDDPEAGCSQWCAQLWVAKYNCLYNERRALLLHGVHHLSMVADPSTHSKRETMASVCWSWEAGGAAHANLQIIPPGTVVLPSEQALPEEVARLAAVNRLERVGAFRQMQALSNAIRGLGNSQWSDLDAFRLPEDWHINPVTGHQVRVVRMGPQTDTAYLFDPETRDRQAVLPDTALASTQGQGVNLLVLGLDQGSVGAAGAAFLDHKGFMVHTKWDKFHRCIRDIKLTLQHCCGGVFLKTQLYTSYLWGVNYKPFGTGLFGTQKMQALNTFVATETADSAIFRKYVDRMARDVGMPCGTPEEREQVFQQLGHIVGSFVRSQEMSKLGRWFSWNGCAHEQLPEYWACKMLYEHHLGAEQDPDDDPVAFDDLEAAAHAKTPFAELMQLKAANGGLRLAYKLMTHQLWQHAKLLCAVTRPCWSWYTKEVKEIKSPRDALLDALTKTRGRWMRDPQFYEIVRNCFGQQAPASTRGSTADVLSDIGIAEGPSKLADRMCTLSWVLIGHRAWSMAVRHHGPPECYADLLSPVEVQAQRAANDMKRNWQALVRLEQRSLTFAPARKLWEDIHLARNAPVRLLHVLFEREKFRPTCRPGLHLLLPQTFLAVQARVSRPAFCVFFSPAVVCLVIVFVALES